MRCIAPPPSTADLPPVARSVLVLSPMNAAPAEYPPPFIARPHPEAVHVAARAADPIRRCRRALGDDEGGGGTITMPPVAFAPDGTLAELPSVAAQRGVTPAITVALPAEVAAPVLACHASLHLLTLRDHGGWGMFGLTFSPRAVA